MMNRLVVRVALLAAVGGVSGCSSLFGQEGYFRDRGDDYLNADMVPPIKLPEGVSQQGIQQLYMVPRITNEEVDFSGSFEVPRPQALSDNAFTDRVKIQKLGDKRWILVSAAPAEVWPQVRSFLSRNNLEVVYTDATNGVIETGWLKFKGDEDTKDKYRLQIEQGVQPDSTEIHVLHMSVNKDIPGRGQVNWPEVSVSEEREAWMMDELAATIASDGADAQTSSLLAQTIGLSDKVSLEGQGGEPYLHLTLDYSRGWATVAHAVKQDGFSLWEFDEVAGVFYVQFDPEFNQKEAEEPGFFSGWFGGKDEPATTPYSLNDVLAHLQPEDTVENRHLFKVTGSTIDPLKEVPGYLVVLDGQSDDVKVRVRDGYGRNIPTRDAKKLLNILRQNLI